MSVLIKKILLPVDFSGRSEEAVSYASCLARHYGAEILLLHAVEPARVSYAMAELPDFAERLTAMQLEGAQLKLASFASGVLDGVKVTRQICVGHPADEILKHDQDADIVVMPTQGHGRVREFLIGSVTAKVLHDCERPVLTGVHLDGRCDPSDWKVKNILCAVDFSPEHVNVLKWGAALASEFGASVTAVHVCSDPASATKLETVVKSAGLKAPSIVSPGEPHKVITHMAEQMGSDLVIIGRGSHPGTLGRLRAQAYEIVRKSPCPVLSV